MPGCCLSKLHDPTPALTAAASEPLKLHMTGTVGMCTKHAYATRAWRLLTGTAEKLYCAAKE